MIAFRHADPRFPFLWEADNQPAARWHGEGEGPVHYLSDTPHGAWAELLRHEEIRDPEDLAGIRRAIWAVELTEPPTESANLDESLLTGGQETYESCRREAARVRSRGEKGMRVPSAALLPGQACGWVVDAGQMAGPERDGFNWVLFGHRPDLVGWPISSGAAPPEELLPRIRHFLAAD